MGMHRCLSRKRGAAELHSLTRAMSKSYRFRLVTCSSLEANPTLAFGLPADLARTVIVASVLEHHGLGTLRAGILHAFFFLLPAPV